jgi:hypothetical protein
MFMNAQLELYSLQTAWAGHEEFAKWLVHQIQPETIVDLGVDYGFSLYALALPRIGKVYGIDSFEYDAHTGSHPDNYNVVMKFKEKHSFDNVHIIKGWFQEIVKTWTTPIQILHIDGLHTYDAITDDWKHWTPFVPDNGVIIMHDVISFPEITQFYNEIQLPKAFFRHSAGLGIATKDQELLNAILQAFSNCKAGNI